MVFLQVIFKNTYMNFVIDLIADFGNQNYL